jgi:hypothetical protein
MARTVAAVAMNGPPPSRLGPVFGGDPVPPSGEADTLTTTGDTDNGGHAGAN